MGDKKIQTGTSDAVLRAEQSVKELEVKNSKVGFEANRVNAANQDKAAHGDAAAKRAIDEAQKKSEMTQKELKEAQTRLNNLKNGQMAQTKTPAPKQESVKSKEPAKTKEQNQAATAVPALAQQPVKEEKDESETFFSRRSNWFERMGESFHSDSVRVFVEVPACRPNPKPQGTVDSKKATKPQGATDPKNIKGAQLPKPSSLESSLSFYCGKESHGDR